MAGERNERFPGSMAIGVGVTQILIALLVLVVGIYWAVLGGAGAIIAPLISAVVFLTAGALGVGAGATRKRGVILASMIVNIIAVFISLAHIIFAGYLALLVTLFTGGWFSWDEQDAKASFAVATPYILLACGVLLFIFTLWQAILGCVGQCSSQPQATQVQMAYVTPAVGGQPGQYGHPQAGAYGQPQAGAYGQPQAGQYGHPEAGQYGGASAPPQNMQYYPSDKKY